MPDSAPLTPLLDAIQSPEDLKRLPPEVLPDLAAEMRDFIMHHVAFTGGHLGSGMGVVELTIALHYLFDLKDDRLVWDVGHQCYPHKLLTGRKDNFHTLRQKDGLSGFMNKWESPYDPYLMGHAGTAASSALGISIGDRLQGRHRHNIAVVGDAAIGAGVAFEALNHAGTLEKDRVLVILNDNRWSIAKTVGALSRYLNRIRSSKAYSSAKDHMHKWLQSIPVVGKDVDESLHQSAEMLRNMVASANVFEDLGFDYFGPIDGHSMPDLLEILERIKDREGVVFLHVKTQKGKGVPGSEDRYDRAHAAKPSKKKPVAEPAAESPAPAAKRSKVEPCVIEPKKPRAKVGAAQAWTKWFGDGICELAQRDERVVALTAAMPDGTGLMEYRDRFPERFFDCGIAEQHTVAMASGLATSGLRPIAAIYSTFLQRGYDQVFQEVVLQKVPVVFAMDRAGLVGEDGATHNGLYDIAYLRTFPDIVLMAPKDGPELQEMLAFATTLDGPSGIRYARGNAPADGVLEELGWHGRREPVQLGRMETLRTGSDGAILAYGHMVETAMRAAALAEDRGVQLEVVNARFVKPLDVAGVTDLARRHDKIVTLEDHSLPGGFGSAVLECLASQGIQAQVQVMAVPAEQLVHMSRNQVIEHVGLTPTHVAAAFAARGAARV